MVASGDAFDKSGPLDAQGSRNPSAVAGGGPPTAEAMPEAAPPAVDPVSFPHAPSGNEPERPG